jgi:cyclophilin family peptidyl-prolyl cis-trans isomerase
MKPRQQVSARRAVWVGALAATATLTAAGCGGGTGAARRGPGAGSAAEAATATPLELAQLESARGASVPRLLELLRRGSRAAQAGAVRALGRIGTRQAAEALIDTGTSAADLSLASAAGAALGVVIATSGNLGAGGLAPSSPDPDAIAAALRKIAARPGIDRAALAIALGQGGDVSALPQLATWIGDSDATVAAAAGAALGRLGRRKLALDDATRSAIIARVGDRERDVRYGALYALAREHLPDGAPAAPSGASALMARLVDPDAEIRMLVIAGLARRGALGIGEPLFVAALDDADPRVAVEAVRAIAGHGSAAGYAAIGDRLQRWARELPARAGTPGVHALLEGLRAVMPIARDAALAAALEATRAELAAQLARTEAPSLALGWSHCLAQAAVERARPRSFDGGHRLMACGGGKLGAGDVAALLAELSLGIRDDGEPTRALASELSQSMMGSRDPRVHVAGLSMVAPIWASLSAEARGLHGASLALSLAAPTTFEAAAAADALGALLGAVPAGAAPDAELADATAALIARASTEADPELAATLVTVIGDGGVAAGEVACRSAAASPHQVVATAARACLAALGAAPAGDTTAGAAPPSRVDPATVIGKQVTWTLELSTGTVVIDLDPALAPANVASLVALTSAHFFDGLLVHRVVPGFVVQTGDPTGTGWGGPGYQVGSEPAAATDGRGFTTGAVGIADAGKDTGGSQWFVMTGPAPHLDGAYTQVGRVRSGQAALDRALIGDTIVRATVDVR